jgi:CMP-N-acetylneuraminic acid synthetase
MNHDVLERIKQVDSKVGVFSFGRSQSTRCPNKMLRSFDQTTLTDILLQKLKYFGHNAFFAANGKKFEQKCKAHGVRFLERSQHSVEIDEPISEILYFLETEKFSHFLIVNGCLPFLSIDTISNFYLMCLKNNSKPAFGVVRRANFFLSSNKKPLNFLDTVETINTKQVGEIYEFAHALYFFEKSFFVKNKRYWNWNEVEFIEMGSRYELIDVDDEEDFEFAEKLWKAN